MHDGGRSNLCGYLVVKSAQVDGDLNMYVIISATFSERVACTCGQSTRSLIAQYCIDANNSFALHIGFDVPIGGECGRRLASREVAYQVAHVPCSSRRNDGRRIFRVYVRIHREEVWYVSDLHGPQSCSLNQPFVISLLLLVCGGARVTI